MGVVTWHPRRRSMVMTQLVGMVAFVLGLFVFGLPVLLIAPYTAATAIGLPQLLMMLVLIGFLVIVHEGLHGLLMRRFGARPRFQAAIIRRTIPVFYVDAVGHHFSRGQYLTVAAAPAVLISALGWLACTSPLAIYLVVPLAAHLAACTADASTVWEVLRQPRGTVIEHAPAGLRFHRP